MTLPAGLTLDRCRFDGGAAAALVEMDGCVCFPHDRLQPLCVQHVASSEPLGGWRVVHEFQPDALDRVFGVLR